MYLFNLLVGFSVLALPTCLSEKKSKQNVDQIKSETTSKINDLTMEFDKLTKTLDETSGKFTKCNVDLGDCIERLTKMAVELETAENKAGRVEGLQQEVSKLEEKLEYSVQLLQEKDSKISEEKETNERFRLMLDEEKRRIDEEKKTIKNLENKLDESRTHKDQDQAIYKQLEDKLAEKQADIKSLRNELAEKSVAFDSLSKILKERDEEIKDIQAQSKKELTDSTERLNDCEKLKDHLKNGLLACETERETQKTRLKKCESETLDHKSRLTKCSENSDKNEIKFNKEMELQRKKLKEAQDVVKDQSKSGSHCIKQMKSLEDLNARFQAQIDAKEREISTAYTRTVWLDKELDKYKLGFGISILLSGFVVSIFLLTRIFKCCCSNNTNRSKKTVNQNSHLVNNHNNNNIPKGKHKSKNHHTESDNQTHSSIYYLFVMFTFAGVASAYLYYTELLSFVIK